MLFKIKKFANPASGLESQQKLFSYSPVSNWDLWVNRFENPILPLSPLRKLSFLHLLRETPFMIFFPPLARDTFKDPFFTSCERHLFAFYLSTFFISHFPFSYVPPKLDLLIPPPRVFSNINCTGR